MPANPFDIRKFDGLTFNNAQYAPIAAYQDGTLGSSHIAVYNFADLGTGDLGKMTVVNDTYVEERFVPGSGPRPSELHLATYGAIQFENVVDGSGNRITFWVHGFSETGLFLTQRQDAFWQGDEIPVFANDPDDPYGGYAFGFYGVDAEGSGSDPNQIHPGAEFDSDPALLTVQCFAEGTRIETSSGPVAVEDLSVGDMVVTGSGEQRPIRWIGQTIARPARHSRPWDVNPVRVVAHAFGANLPERDVRLSPGHAIYVDGVLIPAGRLVNGATIVQETVELIRYFHVELDSHDVLLAEGLPCESYLDDGNRLSFQNVGEFMALYGRLDPQSWENACAPMVADGPQLIAVRERLDAQAEALGWHKDEEPDLAIEADGVMIAPLHHSGTRRWFVVPASAALVVKSSYSILTHVMPSLADGRRLGVALSELRVDGESIDLDAGVFGQGFYPVETHEQSAWRWTDGAAELRVPAERPMMIELSYIMVAPSWKRLAPQLRVVA